MKRLVVVAVLLALFAVSARADTRFFLLFEAGGGTVVLNGNAAYYCVPNSEYIIRDNVSSGTLARNVDFTETLSVDQATAPNGTVIAWSWPIGGWPQAPSYPEIAYGNNHPPCTTALAKQVNTFATLTEQIAYVEGGPNYTYNPLTEMWLTPTTSWPATPSFEIELQLDQTLINNSPYYLPINHHMTSPFGADVFLGGDTNGQQVLIFPTQAYGATLVQNPTMTGSSNGTPGTDPTYANFSVGNLGLTKSIIGSGTTTASDGATIHYVDVGYAGTTSTTGNMQAQIQGYGVGGAWPSGSPGVGLTGKIYLAVVGGATTNITDVEVQMKFYNSGFNQLAAPGGGNIVSKLTSTPQPFGVYATSPANTAYYSAPSVYIGANTGQAVSITLRIGSPFYATGGFAALNNTTVDWKAIYADLIAASVITGNEYAHGIEIGPEVYSGAGSFTINTFAVTWQ